MDKNMTIKVEEIDNEDNENASVYCQLEPNHS